MISAIILTKNEEKNIRRCLNSLSFCDQMIVVDDFSTDKTVDIAKGMKAKVFSRLLDDDFSGQRNFGLEKAQGEWILFIDADERVSSSLRDEINQLTNQAINKYSGFYIKRRDFMWGRELKHGETGGIKLLRLARKNSGLWHGKVHEKWEVKGEMGQLKNAICHYPHETLTEFLQEINYYTDIRAQEIFMQGSPEAGWLSIILYPLGKFFVNYFLKLGFFDGIPGFIFAILMSFHSFLVRAKLRLLWQKK